MATPRKGAPQFFGIGMAGISMGFSVMDDFASVPRPVSARSPCLPCVLTSPKGTSRDAHLEPVQGRVSQALRADDCETDRSPGAAARAIERRPLTELRAAEDFAHVRQVRRALRGERESRANAERERGDECAEPVHHGILRELVSASSELYGFL